jgi:hypothetical protein
MTHSLAALTLASLITTEDPNMRAWTAVQWARDVRRVTGRTAAIAMTSCDRPCIDALPWEAFASRAPSVAEALRHAFADDAEIVMTSLLNRKIGGV